MNNANKLLRVLLVVLAIPVVGFAVSYFIIQDINKGLADDGIDVAILCDALISGRMESRLTSELSEACSEITNIQTLGRASVFAAVIGGGIPILYWLTSILAGQSRQRIAFIFPTTLRISILLIAITVLLQGAILTYAAYVGESYAIERIHPFVIGAIGLGALVGGFKLIEAAMSFGGKLKMNVFGKVLTASQAPQLFEFVKSLSSRLGAKVPNNIIVGLEPTFYVTSSDIQVPGADNLIKGETLYISAPLSRLLSQAEFASVIGHELGHFRGDDTTYSMKFAPVYAGLGKALGAISSSQDDGASGLANLPALAMLDYMYQVFAINESTISRDREHKADKAGAEAGSPLALATALIKVSLYAGLWEHARHQNVERLNQGKIANNLSQIFQDTARYDVEHENIGNIMNVTLDKKITHPTDTHPTVASRLEALGVQAEKITKDMLMVPQKPAVDIIDRYSEIEEEITLLEHRFMVAIGVARPPEDTQTNHFLHASYSLAAAMVGADGKIDPNEITVAETIGKEYFSDFDSIEFRQYCNNPSQISDIEEIAKTMGEVLEEANKHAVMRYLIAISEADGHVSVEEQKLLERIATSLGLSLPINR